MTAINDRALQYVTRHQISCVYNILRDRKKKNDFKLKSLVNEYAFFFSLVAYSQCLKFSQLFVTQFDFQPKVYLLDLCVRKQYTCLPIENQTISDITLRILFSVTFLLGIHHFYRFFISFIRNVL